MSETDDDKSDSGDLSAAEIASGKLRLDKWLWFARFFKTRSLAAKMCAAGGMRCGGVLVSKASVTVKPGDVLTFSQGKHVRVIKVLGLGTRRGPAPEAQALYEDLAPPSRETAMPDAAPRPGGPRPTKKDRRALDGFMNDRGDD
jgi:ribosome-associated heat shock protein Hsp15